MSKIRLKFAINEINGPLYEVDSRPIHQEEIISTECTPHSSGEPTEAQKAQRQLFKQAAAYAKAALSDPQLRARYEEMAKQQGKRARGAAIADCLKGNNLFSGE
jgi:hypothetical protein